MFSKKANTREAIGRWIRYANEGIKIEALAEKSY